MESPRSLQYRGAPIHHSVGGSCTEGVCMLWHTLYRQNGFGFTVRQIRRTMIFS